MQLHKPILSLWKWTDGSHLQSPNLISALGPDQQHLDCLMTPQTKAVCEEGKSSSHWRQGRKASGRKGGREGGAQSWSLHKVPANTGVFCTSLERVHGSYSALLAVDWIEEGEYPRLYTYLSEVGVSPWSAWLEQDQMPSLCWKQALWVFGLEWAWNLCNAKKAAFC